MDCISASTTTIQTLLAYQPCCPLHKVLTFLLSRNDSLQVYTLAMQVKEVERQQRSCFHHHCFRCHHLQTGHGACRDNSLLKNSNKQTTPQKGQRKGDNTKAEVAIDMPEHVWKSDTKHQSKAENP